MPKSESKGDLDIALILRAMNAFKHFTDFGPVLLPSHLYDKAKEAGVKLEGYARRATGRWQRGKLSIVTKTPSMKVRQNTGPSMRVEQIRNSYQNLKPSNSNSINAGICELSTSDKTWKWKEGSKRRWKWTEEAKLNHWSRKYTGDRYAIKYFKWMWDRCIKADRKCDFPRSKEGYEAFCKEMGPIPESIMKRPSVGRKNHNKGYVYGNIVWERYEYNVWKKRRSEQDIQEESENEIPF